MSKALKYQIKPHYDTISSAFNAANYARLNPADTPAATSLDEGYLRATFGAGLNSAKFSIPKRDGKFVVEVTRNAPSTANAVGAGLSTAAFSTTTWLGEDANGFCLYSENFGIYESNSQVSASPTWDDTNTSFVMAVDLTGENPVVSFVLDNESTIDTVYTWTNATLSTEEVYLTLSGSATDSITLNTGRLRWRNKNIKRLFPDYELGWPDRVDADVIAFKAAAAGGGRIMGSLAGLGGLAGPGGLAGRGGGLAG